MRPARFLLASGVGSLAFAAMTSLVRVLQGGRLDEAIDRFLFTGAEKVDPWLASVAALDARISGHFLYFGVLCLMLWAIWRDDRAEWTVAASSAVKLAMVCVAAAVLLLFSWNVIQFQNDRDYFHQNAGQLNFIWSASIRIAAFGFTLWLHALASNQIPKLMEIAVARRPMSIGAGLLFFWAGFACSLVQFAPPSIFPERSGIGLQVGAQLVSSSIGMPLLLISYSLLSMGFLAGRELLARSHVLPPATGVEKA